MSRKTHGLGQQRLINVLASRVISFGPRSANRPGYRQKVTQNLLRDEVMPQTVLREVSIAVLFAVRQDH